MAVAPQSATLERVPVTTSVEEILAIVQRDGGVIIEGFLSKDVVDRFNVEIQPALDAINPGSTHDNEDIAAFHGAQTKRLTSLPTHSPTFRDDILDHELVHSVADAVFAESGTYWLTTAQVIEIGPGNTAQVLHRDLGNWAPFIPMGPTGPEAIINFLIAFTDFTEENGATRVIPGSNHWPDFEDCGDPEMTIPAEMKAGDALLISGKTVHGGGANVTADEKRRGCSFSLNLGYLTGEEAFTLSLDREVVKTLPPRVQRVLGFRSQYPTGSPGLWQIDYADVADYLGLDS